MENNLEAFLGPISPPRRSTGSNASSFSFKGGSGRAAAKPADSGDAMSMDSGSRPPLGHLTVSMSAQGGGLPSGGAQPPAPPC